MLPIEDEDIEISLAHPFLVSIAVHFIILKITGYVSWSWAFTLLPLYLPFIGMGIGIIVFLISVLMIRLNRKFKNYGGS